MSSTSARRFMRRARPAGAPTARPWGGVGRRCVRGRRRRRPWAVVLGRRSCGRRAGGHPRRRSCRTTGTRLRRLEREAGEVGPTSGGEAAVSVGRPCVDAVLGAQSGIESFPGRSAARSGASRSVDRLGPRLEAADSTTGGMAGGCRHANLRHTFARACGVGSVALLGAVHGRRLAAVGRTAPL